jgi:hypothetical protein
MLSFTAAYFLFRLGELAYEAERPSWTQIARSTAPMSLSDKVANLGLSRCLLTVAIWSAIALRGSPFNRTASNRNRASVMTVSAAAGFSGVGARYADANERPITANFNLCWSANSMVAVSIGAPAERP